MKGRTAIITGAASGIGLSVARRLLDEGAEVVGADLSRQVIGWEPPFTHDRLTWQPCDVTVEDEVAVLTTSLMERAGRIDVLVNVAGVTTSGHLVEDLSLEEWRRVLDTNLTGSFLCIKHVVPAMKRHGRGAIVNVASSSAIRPSQPGQSAYSASKGGVAAMTRELCLELAPHGITVNAIAPGPTRTPMVANFGTAWFEEKARVIPAGRVAEPEELAAAVAFLVSDEGRYVNGHLLAVDGGMTAVVMS